MKDVLLKLLCIGVLCFAPACQSADDSDKVSDSAHYARLRRDMVDSQIRLRGISDTAVLKAMLTVERHLFVPRYYRPYSYTDGPLPIGEDQTISQPYIVALMTELLDLDSTEKVLEIGTGSGYQAAVLAEIADSVFTIEIIPELAEQSEKLLTELGYTNITVRCGDGFVGWEEHAPFDGIIVTCAPVEIPEPLLTQLAEGGRLVIPVGEMWQELILVTKTNGKTQKESIIPVRFVPMTGKAAEKK